VETYKTKILTKTKDRLERLFVRAQTGEKSHGHSRFGKTCPIDGIITEGRKEGKEVTRGCTKYGKGETGEGPNQGVVFGRKVGCPLRNLREMWLHLNEDVERENLGRMLKSAGGLCHGKTNPPKEFPNFKEKCFGPTKKRRGASQQRSGGSTTFCCGQRPSNEDETHLGTKVVPLLKEESLPSPA